MASAEFTVAILVGETARAWVKTKRRTSSTVSRWQSVWRSQRRCRRFRGAVHRWVSTTCQRNVRNLEKDAWPGEGPLGGLITALKCSSHDAVVVLSCDMPFITPAVVSSLVAALADAQASVGRTDRLNWLCAAWSKSECLSTLQSVWKRNERAMHRAAVLLDVAEVPVPAVAVRNINSPDDLAPTDAQE